MRRCSQEILHRYTAIDRRDTIGWAFQALLDVVAEVFPVEKSDVLRSRPVYAYRFEGKRYDAGDKVGFLKATVEFALHRHDLGEEFRTYLKTLQL